MSGKSRTASKPEKSASLFSNEERAAMLEAARERRARLRNEKLDPEGAVLAKIAEMKGSDRVLAQRLHALIRANAPRLSCRTWYGMPAYTVGEQVLCYFRPAAKFGTRYATLGFSDAAKLDEGPMWATEFALREMTPKEEARIASLVKRAVG